MIMRLFAFIRKLDRDFIRSQIIFVLPTGFTLLSVVTGAHSQRRQMLPSFHCDGTGNDKALCDMSIPVVEPWLYHVAIYHSSYSVTESIPSLHFISV